MQPAHGDDAAAPGRLIGVVILRDLHEAARPSISSKPASVLVILSTSSVDATAFNST
jgi:hypothetical protein